MSSLTRKKILLILSSIWGIFSGIALIFYFTSHIYVTYTCMGMSLIFCLLLCVAINDITQTKHTLLRNYPLIGRLRKLFEGERSKIQQYFVESDINGTPYTNEERSDIYQKAKQDANTVPFGTQLDVYKEGYEFLKHSMYPTDVEKISEPRITIGSKFCLKPYNASIFNVSAMSWGALSSAAVRALNGGAKLGNFYTNTGEGGVSPYHLENGGDLVFQFGTGYFGCGETINGKRYFDDNVFLDVVNASPQIKMIEIKSSQGAKPGTGGLLPAKKNTPEIAKVRHTEPYKMIISPAYHTAFGNPIELIGFIKKLRTLSGGLPIGFKLCLGDVSEFENLVKEMKKEDCYPDYFVVDGGEGGTGSAHLSFTNHIGTPLTDALIKVDKILKSNGLRDDIKIIASGKAFDSFTIVRLLSLGADAVNAARAFMFSLGCIQARECDRNTCPVGIATQNQSLIEGLDVSDKKVRVYNYHKSVVEEIKDILAAMGLTKTSELNPDRIFVRIGVNNTKSYGELI